MSDWRRHRITALATLLLTADIATWVITGVLAAQFSNEPLRPADLAYVLSFLVFPVVGWLVAVKLPGNPLGWIYLLFSLFGAFGTLAEGLAPMLAYAENLPAAAVLMLGGGWLYGLALLLILGPSVLLFPDGQLPGRRWRFVLWASAVLIVLSLVLPAFGVSTVCVEPAWEKGVLAGCARQVDNPLRLAVMERLNTIGGPVVEALLALTVALSLAGLLVRYRRSAGDVRQQIKWVVFAAAAGIVPLILITLTRQLLEFAGFELIDSALLLSFTIVLPVAIGVAIFRYRLYDIDRIISRTAAYAIVVGLLAAVFAASVALVRQLLPFRGEPGVVLSTLVVAALFDPLRRRVQNSVDRRFNRSKYDVQGVLDQLSDRLRDDVELALMQSALLEAALETMQPSHLSLWVREPTSTE